MSLQIVLHKILNMPSFQDSYTTVFQSNPNPDTFVRDVADGIKVAGQLNLN